MKSDPLAGLLTYTTDKNTGSNLVTITAKRAFEVLSMNRRGEKPDKLEDGSAVATSVPTDLAEQDSLTRFDKNKMRKKKHRKNRPQHQKPNRPQDDNQAENKNEGEKS